MFTPSEPLLPIIGAPLQTRVFRSLEFTVRRAVAVLLLFGPMAGGAASSDVDHARREAFAFTSELHLPMGRSTLSGRMVSDGRSCRIAIYWIEPAPLREGTHFLRHADLLFSSDLVRYRLEGLPQTQTLPLSTEASGPLLPRDPPVDSVVRSALAIVRSIRRPDGPLEIGRFFRESRDSSECKYEVTPDQADTDKARGDIASDVQVLNALPYGRQCSKETRNDGAVVWRVRKAMDDQPLFTVAVKPLPDVDEAALQDAFDPNTLGRWMFVPEPYRAYWSFDRRYSILNRSEGVPPDGEALCDDIRSFLHGSNSPAEVRRALDRLRFKTSLSTGDPNRVLRSLRAAVRGLCQDESVSAYRGLRELAEIASQIEERYPQQADQWLRPLARQMVGHGGDDVPRCLGRLTTLICTNRWFRYGRLLLEEVRSQGTMDDELLDALAAKLEASRLSLASGPPDPAEPTASVRRYLAQLDALPPRGNIDMNDVRHILKKGLAEHYTDAEAHAKRAVVQRAIRSIRLTVGDGPFRGDPDALIESARRFSKIYFDVRKIAKPVDTVLATLLALSFCDVSTPGDHEELRAQFHTLASHLKFQVNTRLDMHELGALVGPQDVEEAFAEQEHIFQTYVDDPLWPPFKFPLTANEQIRLANKLELRLERAEPLLREVSDKVRYGGISERLKRRTVYEISRIAEQLMVDAAFLRKPAYPGVYTQYRGRHGFTAVIDSPFYEPGKRPRERFQAMKYFHLGHRLHEIVQRERNLARPSKSPSD